MKKTGILLIVLVSIIYMVITVKLYTLFPWIAMLGIALIYGWSNGNENNTVATQVASFILVTFSTCAAGSVVWLILGDGNYADFLVYAAMSVTAVYLLSFLDGRTEMNKNISRSLDREESLFTSPARGN